LLSYVSYEHTSVASHLPLVYDTSRCNGAVTCWTVTYSPLGYQS